MSKYTGSTPGPWHAEIFESPVWVISNGRRLLAQIVGGNDAPNARLIADAPELVTQRDALLAVAENLSDIIHDLEVAGANLSDANEQIWCDATEEIEKVRALTECKEE